MGQAEVVHLAGGWEGGSCMQFLPGLRHEGAAVSQNVEWGSQPPPPAASVPRAPGPQALGNKGPSAFRRQTAWGPPLPVGPAAPQPASPCPETGKCQEQLSWPAPRLAWPSVLAELLRAGRLSLPEGSSFAPCGNRVAQPIRQVGRPFQHPGCGSWGPSLAPSLSTPRRWEKNFSPVS